MNFSDFIRKFWDFIYNGIGIVTKLRQWDLNTWDLCWDRYCASRGILGCQRLLMECLFFIINFFLTYKKLNNYKKANFYLEQRIHILLTLIFSKIKKIL